jgi:coenzyme Q-binding protein COQ10
MAMATRNIQMNVTADQLYDVLVDYERYPEFCDDVAAIQVLSRNGDRARVKFTIKVIKSIEYTLDLVGVPGKSLKWTLADSKWMKTNNGGWDIESGAGGVDVRYGVEVTLGMFVPKRITQKIVETTFPAMLKQFKTRAESLHR